MDMLRPADAQQQIQSFYFIEVMNDYIQDAQKGQAFLLNEIRKNTGNIRLRADNVTMNTQQQELLLGGLIAHVDYNELMAQTYTDPGVAAENGSPPLISNYFIQEVNGDGEYTGNLLLTQDPVDLVSTDEQELSLQDVLWETIPGVDGADDTYKEYSLFRYARDQIAALKEVKTAVEGTSTSVQLGSLISEIGKIHTSTIVGTGGEPDTDETKSLVDVVNAVNSLGGSLAGTGSTTETAIYSLQSTVEGALVGSILGINSAWTTWNEAEDPDPLTEPNRYQWPTNALITFCAW